MKTRHGNRLASTLLSGAMIAGAVLAVFLPPTVHAQSRERVQLSGHADLVSDFYVGNGVNRWPGSAWRMNLSPRATLFGEATVGFDVLLSSSQSDFRQNVNQLGVSPTWGWGTAHLGDFSRDYSKYLIQGMRLRGAGLELRRGAFEFEVQGGRAQRTVTVSELGEGTTAFRRRLVAARLGVGASTGSHLNLSILSGRDDLGQTDEVIVVPDTMFLDTIPADLRPTNDSRPQDNLAMSMAGQLALSGRTLLLRGQFASSLITRDRLADRVSEQVDELSLPGGLYPLIDRLHDIRLSTGLDHAWELEGTVNAGPGRFRAGFESVGPGFTSMGLGSMVNDRRSFRMDAATRHRDGRVSLQGQFRTQTNNLAGHLRNTIDRQTFAGTMMLRPTDVVNLTFSGVLTTLANDAAADSARLDNQALALTSNVAVQRELAGLPAVFSVGYNFQQARDESPVAFIPMILTHNVTGSVQVTLNRTVSIAPSLSAVTSNGDGMDPQRNLYVGFRGNARWLDGDLRTSGNVAQTVNQGRKIFNSQAQLSYPMGWDTDVRLQARHNRYSAFGNRPEFEESFVTFSLSRRF